MHGKELHSVSITVCKDGENHANMGIGDLLSTLPPEMQNDPNIKTDCEVYNGEYYYIGKGSGGEIKSVTEENGTVTVTDDSGNKLVFNRTGENTLKCTSAPNSFTGISAIPVGSVFTFVAE